MGRCRKKLDNYKDELVKLYRTVGNNPFYTRDINHVFPPQRITMLTTQNILEPSGEFYLGDGMSHNRRYNKWQFTKKGRRVVDSFAWQMEGYEEIKPLLCI
jgi:hypothetical protein